MRAPLARVLAVCLWACLMLLATSHPTWAASRHIFPDIRADALLRSGNSRAVDDIDALYLYGSLALLEQRTGPYRVDIAKAPYRHLLPLATLNIYHDIQTYVQIEFSDYTIWGTLADFMFHEASRIPYEVERSRALRKIQVVRRRHGRARSQAAYPDAIGGELPSARQQRDVAARRTLGASASPVGMQADQPLFDLRGDHVFQFEEPVRHHGEQRQFYARSDFPAGRGGRNYHPEGIIAQTLQRILAVAQVLFDHKMMTIAGLGIAVAFIKMTQNMLSRQRRGV